MRGLKSFLTKRRGFILMTSYLLISVFSIFSLSFLVRGNHFLNSTERNRNRLVAFNMAEAGLDFALAQLVLDPNWAGSNYTGLNTNFVQGGYDVAVTTPPNNPLIRIIQATGYSPSNIGAARAFESRSVTGYAQLDENNFFDFAVFAKDNVRLNGSPTDVVDSYDSRNGPYNPAAANSNGDVGTDSVGAGTVQLIGNATVKGDVEVGPGGDPNQVISMGPNTSITGASSAADAARDYEPQTTDLPSLGNYNIGGNTVDQIPGGTYHYDSLTIKGQATLQPLGAVVIYVSGSVNIGGGGIATQNNLPPNFLIYVKKPPGAGSVEVNVKGNNATFYGAIFAPEADVKVTGDIYGAVVGKTYTQSGTGSLHYDEALKEEGGSGNAGITLLAWQENNTSAWGTGS